MEHLVESALLTHGLRSVTDERLAAVWPVSSSCVAWVDGGHVTVGGMDDFLPFRDRASELVRIDATRLDNALASGTSGALTASGTMEVCRRMGIPLAVSCGIGGIGNIRGEELCPDLPALRDLPVVLLCTSPKDMLDRPATFVWLRRAGVRLVGLGRGASTGYVFAGEPVALDEEAPTDRAPFDPGHPGRTLVLNEIPESRRVANHHVLVQAVVAAHEAEACGEYFHPAANAKIDELTAGDSSLMQLEALVANARLAASW